MAAQKRQYRWHSILVIAVMMTASTLVASASAQRFQIFSGLSDYAISLAYNSVDGCSNSAMPTELDLQEIISEETELSHHPTNESPLYFSINIVTFPYVDGQCYVTLLYSIQYRFGYTTLPHNQELALAVVELYYNMAVQSGDVDRIDEITYDLIRRSTRFAAEYYLEYEFIDGG